MTTRMTRVLICLFLAVIVFNVSSYGAEPVQKYDVHDKGRKNPPVVTPPERPGQPPADAIILFDGENTSEWVSDKKPDKPIEWKVENGYMEVTQKMGGIHTKRTFGNCQLHIEWRTPEGVDPAITDQKRSNSGIHFMGKYEVQILDSYTKDL